MQRGGRRDDLPNDLEAAQQLRSQPSGAMTAPCSLLAPALRSLPSSDGFGGQLRTTAPPKVAEALGIAARMLAGVNWKTLLAGSCSAVILIGAPPAATPTGVAWMRGRQRAHPRREADATLQRRAPRSVRYRSACEDQVPVHARPRRPATPTAPNDGRQPRASSHVGCMGLLVSLWRNNGLLRVLTGCAFVKAHHNAQIA